MVVDGEEQAHFLDNSGKSFSNTADRHEEGMSELYRSPARKSEENKLAGQSSDWKPFINKDKKVDPHDSRGKSPEMYASNASSKYQNLPAEDRPRFVLLVILYMIQGIPIGLAFGSVPFLLKTADLSYSQVGIFSLATYPYAMKLLWSPLVDSIYSPRIGRRRSWIIPIQVLSGFCLLLMGWKIDDLMKPESLSQNLAKLAWWFFILIFFLCNTGYCRGWMGIDHPLEECLELCVYRTDGGNQYRLFFEFHHFLAFNSPNFANKYLRSVPSTEGVITLGQYMRLAGVFYLVVTFIIALLVPENPQLSNSDGDSSIELSDFTAGKKNDDHTTSAALNASDEAAVRRMFSVIKLRNVRTFICLLLVCKIAFQANEGATDLKLLDKGFSREDLAITVLIDFPFEIIFGYYVARWSSGSEPLKPWLYGYLGRIAAALLGQFLVARFPKSGKIGTFYFLCVIGQHLLSSFMSTVQFVCISAFHTKIADPAIGGTYMTTLNTLSNMGRSVAENHPTCIPDAKNSSPSNIFQSESFYNCYASDMKQQCIANGGICTLERDGYYVTNLLCIVLGLVLYYGWLRKTALRLQSLPVGAWRVSKPTVLPL
ncbi:hypothetical protein HII12_004947 [Brettanomyces bruxellensis]|uniref:Uncharacterized protein n=1 Tax=Dekkera bruxellensis TaxID=5007 RepID=A0A8H6B7R2_DEKBR|nr:hypothetical protein HII12_004947 [Brettanomyces bruxellensis]